MFINNKKQTPKTVSRILGTLLQDCLGTYTYDNGQSRVAVSIGKPNKNAKLKGLELVIPAAPDIVNHLEKWTCYIIDKNDDSLGTLANAVDRLRCFHTVIERVAYLPAVKELGNYEQVVFVTNTGAINVIEARLKLG